MKKEYIKPDVIVEQFIEEEITTGNSITFGDPILPGDTEIEF